jgi:putative hydrolase of the HAD superfamily
LSKSSFTELGFADELLLFSYQEGRGKPSRELFDKLDKRLQTMGMGAEQVLFVGNDMKKDIQPARAVGWKTALFGGDRRSLRWHGYSSKEKENSPDLVITDLAQLKSIVSVYR